MHQLQELDVFGIWSPRSERPWQNVTLGDRWVKRLLHLQLAWVLLNMFGRGRPRRCCKDFVFSSLLKEILASGFWYSFFGIVTFGYLRSTDQPGVPLDPEGPFGFQRNNQGLNP